MTDSDTYDLVVLGAGSGGYACALRAAELGLRVALVEKDRLGGTCLHVGCIPTKALLHAAEIADATREAGRFGVRARLDGIDLPAVKAYRDAVVTRLFKGLTGLVRSRGITVVEGEGRLTARGTVAVGDRTLSARHVVLATGSVPRSLPGLDVDGERVLSSDHALELDTVPASAIVVGGGAIGCEFASVWRSFGAEVTLVEALPRLVPGEDEASSAGLARQLEKRGIKVRVGAGFTSVDRTADGVRMVLADGTALEADVVLVAVGRVPRTDGLGLEVAGVELDGAAVKVDERCRTTAPDVYAVGDLTPGPQLAHRWFQQGIFVAEEIAGLDPEVVPHELVPRVTYSEPEVASVGITEAAAVQRHGAEQVEATTYDLGGNGRSQILRTQGFVKVVRLKDGPVVGVHIVGSRAGELIGEAQLVVGWEAHPEDVAPFLHAHPTQGEALGEAMLALAGKPLHTHG
jgi:dihydrolipoamide dehydrogenase